MKKYAGVTPLNIALVTGFSVQVISNTVRFLHLRSLLIIVSLALFVPLLVLEEVCAGGPVSLMIEPSFTFNPQSFTLEDGGELTLEVVPTDFPNFDATKLQDLDNEFVHFDHTSLKVKAKDRGLTTTEATTKIKIKYVDGQTTVESEELAIKIKPKARNLHVVSGKSETPLIGNMLQLVQGETEEIKLQFTDSADAKVTVGNLLLVSDKPSVVDTKAGTPPSVKAISGSSEAANVSVRIATEPAARSELAFKAQVNGAIESIVIDDGQSISIPEGESLTLRIRILGPGGATYDFSGRPDIAVTSDHPEIVSVARDGSVILTAQPITAASPTNPQQATITFATAQGVGNEPFTSTIRVTVTEKFGYITFEPPPIGFLLPDGTFSTTAIVHRKNSAILIGQGVEFTLANEAEDSKWVTLAPEGNKLNVYWNEPPDGDNSTRPAQVRVNVTAHPPGGGVISGKVFFRMGEIAKFAPMKVKLNLMDERTASDLYGSITNKEYYVMTVRLFNNLKDQDTNQNIGASILAYSASIEVAVGLEKKFDAGTESSFPVISKSQAHELERKRAEAAYALANTRADEDIAAAKVAATKLKDASQRQADAELLANEKETTALGLQYKAIETDSAADYDAADAATKDAILARKQAELLARNTDQIRASIARAAANRASISQSTSFGSDPNTAINNGKWYPVGRMDLERISAVPAPAPLSLLPFNRNYRNRNSARRASPGRGMVEVLGTDDERPDPSCNGVVTYRPFTFEMMVNTVDRRDGRSFRTNVFRLLDLLGTTTSFVTGVAKPGPGSDLPLGLEKYANLLVPGLDKLFPSLKEQQRQNIVSQAMKPFEEIPFGSDITRVIFIPKKTIRGLIRGHETRISEVCPYFFRIEVAIVKKGGTFQQGTINR